LASAVLTNGYVYIQSVIFHNEINFKEEEMKREFLHTLGLVLILYPLIAVAQPVIVVDPNTYEDDLNVGDVVEWALSISNEGEDNLIWNSGIDYIEAPAGAENRRWLTRDPLVGEIEAGNQQDVICQINAGGLFGGRYEAELHIRSNDLANPDIAISVVLTAMGIPDIRVVWQEEAGFPDVIDFNRVLPDIFVGISASVIVRVENVGTDRLTVSEIRSNNNLFRADPVRFVVPPEVAREVTLTYQSEDDDPAEATLIFSSDDDDQPQIEVEVIAVAVNPPDITADEDSLRVNVANLHGECDLRLSNAGESDLRWAASLVQTAGPVYDSTEVTINLDPRSGAIQPGAITDMNIDVDFIRRRAVDQDYELTIDSNDPETPILTIMLEVRVSQSAELELTPVPQELIINSAFPNPFNPSTTVNFNLPAKGDITLTIYNATGMIVEESVHHDLPAGEHQLSWDADMFPTGVYTIGITHLGLEKRVRVVRLR
jgi:hypothetical protein